MKAQQKPTRVWLAMTDHFEPLRGNASLAVGQERVRAWAERWPEIARSAPRDHAGRPPQYSFFYPEEEYRPELVEPLACMAHAGIADVEVHIHHDREPRDVFVRRMATFCQTLYSRHGLLRQVGSRILFGFIHGNWALDNSLPGGKWCGLNDEIAILRDLGCYADFTMPSGNSHSQARMVNQIYWCTDDPHSPKSYDTGAPVTIGGGRRGDLMMITGPLGLRYRERLVPRMETGELAAHDVATPYRVRRWFELAPRIGTDLFIKLYAHGALESNAAALLNGGLPRLFELISAEAGRREIQLLYATAWQMYAAIIALAEGRDPAAELTLSLQHF
jgi:hypothetical protein